MSNFGAWNWLKSGIWHDASKSAAAAVHTALPADKHFPIKPVPLAQCLGGRPCPCRASLRHNRGVAQSCAATAPWSHARLVNLVAASALAPSTLIVGLPIRHI